MTTQCFIGVLCIWDKDCVLWPGEWIVAEVCWEGRVCASLECVLGHKLLVVPSVCWGGRVSCVCVGVSEYFVGVECV